MPNPEVSTTLQQAQEVLAARGFSAPLQEARRLLAAHLEMDISVLWTLDIAMQLPEPRLFATRLAARAQHQPLSRIFARRAFWKGEFTVSAAVLDPRPDSEWLLETALRFCQQPPRRILDLGTGSGCLLLSALGEFPDAVGLGVDCCPEALAVAAENAHRLELTERVSWHCGDWLTGIDGHFDLILANPPYIPAGHPIPSAVRYDPPKALFSGFDGLDAYRAIFAKLTGVLAAERLAVCECAPDQTAALASIAVDAGLRVFSLLDVHHHALHPAQQIGIVVVAHTG